MSPFSRYVTAQGHRVHLYAAPLDAIPADFFADPDGRWTFESLAVAAGFGTQAGVAIGALRVPFNDHPDGAAVVTLNSDKRPYIAIVECPIGYELAQAEAASAA
jgi:hypothetical protein